MILGLVTITAAFLIRTLIVFVIIGVCLWLVDTFIPMPAPMKVVLRVVMVLLLVLWLLDTFQII